MTGQDLPLIDELHRKIGRNLLRFQQIEAILKSMLPYIHPGNNPDSLESWLKFQGIVSTKTLGMLVKDLDHSIEATPDDVLQKLKMSVAAPNELVHHFFQRPGIATLRTAGIHEGIAI